MGRTVPSFRIALAMEENEWKPFRNALDKSDRKKLDEMFDIPKLYISACSNAVHPIRLYPILMSIMLYGYEELSKCISQVDQMMVKFEGLQMVEEDSQPQQSKLFDF